MKVKIGDKTYDSNKEPIMIILSVKDKEDIKSMISSATKYCSFPENGFTEERILKFMEEDI